MTKVLVDSDEGFRHYVFFMATKQVRPTKAELSILRVLWNSGPQSVREIQTALNEIKPTGESCTTRLSR